jgi:septal ring factor EnvC (AmiA/AmiB activator)
MNKWIAIPVISVLAVAVIGGGYFLWQQISKLGDAESEIITLEDNVAALEGEVASLEGNVAALEGDVAGLEGDVSTLEADLAESEATASTLEADLGTANSKISGLQGDLSTQRTINSSLTDELKMVKDPRHFSSIQELTDWLQEDDTDMKYTNESQAEQAFILQVRALRAGYLLPAFIGGGEGINLAIIGHDAYIIDPSNDDTDHIADVIDPLPSHPLPLD